MSYQEKGKYCKFKVFLMPFILKFLLRLKKYFKLEYAVPLTMYISSYVILHYPISYITLHYIHLPLTLFIHLITFINLIITLHSSIHHSLNHIHLHFWPNFLATSPFWAKTFCLMKNCLKARRISLICLQNKNKES